MSDNYKNTKTVNQLSQFLGSYSNFMVGIITVLWKGQFNWCFVCMHHKILKERSINRQISQHSQPSAENHSATGFCLTPTKHIFSHGQSSFQSPNQTHVCIGHWVSGDETSINKFRCLPNQANHPTAYLNWKWRARAYFHQLARSDQAVGILNINPFQTGLWKWEQWSINMMGADIFQV